MDPITTRAQIACQGKEGHTASKAREIAQEMRRRGRKRIDAYHCKHCGSWHVGGSTSMPDKRRDVQKTDDEEWQHG